MSETTTSVWLSNAKARHQETASGPTNALVQEPLPEYTASWGPNLRRPAKLPEHYDTRIDPAHIFVFTVHPITGIEREMRVLYQQPHLVPPMKLTVFDGLPPTPTPPPPSQLSNWMAHGKASLRSSLSMRRQTPRPSISSPRPPLPDSQQLPFRRAAQQYRPLELSIYMPSNRLSDLPAFDRLSFTAIGEIKMPPRALRRPSR